MKTIDDNVSHMQKTVVRDCGGANMVSESAVATKGGGKDTEIAVADEERTKCDVEGPEKIKPNLNGDMLNIGLLVLLYVLQGIPIGISAAIRTYVQNKKISYGQQV